MDFQSTVTRGQGIVLAAALAIPGIAASTAALIDSRPVHAEQSSNLFDIWVKLPAPKPYTAPRIREQTKQIRARTGWSQRRLATILNTTHPTVKALQQGRPVTRVKDIAVHLSDIDRIVERVFILAKRRPQETNRILSTTTRNDRLSAADLLQNGDPAGAYLAALQVLRPQTARSGMVSGLWPSRPGGATMSLEQVESD